MRPSIWLVFLCFKRHLPAFEEMARRGDHFFLPISSVKITLQILPLDTVLSPCCQLCSFESLLLYVVEQ